MDLLGTSSGESQFPKDPELCCIYTVPNCLRRVNPEAYTPQLVLIGPLQHSLKSQEVITNAKSMDYLKMEGHKKNYLRAFKGRFGGQTTINYFRGMIERDEVRIRSSYSVSTVWIEPQAFVLMILEDSVFILELLWKAFERRGRAPAPAEIEAQTEDPLTDEPCHASTIRRDLILLENQLPYFILENLFNSIPTGLRLNQTLRELTISYFGGVGQIIGNSTFKHFTDLYRCIRVNTLPLDLREDGSHDHRIKHMYNADKLDSGGVKLVAVGEAFSLEVKFENDYLQIHPFIIDGNTEVTLRNIMALEQCHYPRRAYVCNYIIFLNYLIDTEKDVDLLVERGIIRNEMGRHGLVAEIINKLCSGVVEFGNYYFDIATQVINHYVDPEGLSAIIDLELGMSPRMWLCSRDVEHCCIYRVPDNLRGANPEAYTPLLVLIGPLHHSLKAQAFKARGDIKNAMSMGYLNMVVHKKNYLAKFSERAGLENAITQFRETIEHAERQIRASYSESTAWIKSPEFVEMILEDSVFILEFLLKSLEIRRLRLRDREAKTGDPLMDEFSLRSTIKRDLMLLENQLPFFILNRLYNHIPRQNKPDPAFRSLISFYLGVGKIAQTEKVLHFTDFLRFNRAKTVIPLIEPTPIPKCGHICNLLLCFCAGTPAVLNRLAEYDPLNNMYNVETLDSGGVKFQAVGEEPSLVVNFVNGYLQLPSFSITRNTEVQLRNIMALEECHFRHSAHVSNYIYFLDFLIDTEKDVDLLVEKGIIKSKAGQSRVVAEIVNKLSSGSNDYGSYYSGIATQVMNYYKCPCIKKWAALKRFSFTNWWKGIATLAAAVILAMTIGQFVVAVIESNK